jgi:carboxyl-terminal processing protease
MPANARGIVLAVAIVAAAAILGGLYGPPVRATGANLEDINDQVARFARVLALVEANYADPIDADKLIYEGAIPGMLRALDPHSSFFDARQFTLIREDQRGKYYGVGMQVAPRDGRTIVMAPFVGSPAYKAGIRPGDVILAVDSKPTDGLSTAEVADLLKGPKGTVVRISIGREGENEPVEFTVTRDEIPRPGVDQALVVAPGVGYIRINGFNETTDRELNEAMRKLDGSLTKGLILDLRNNPGGLLNEGVAVADMFLDKNQLIVSHRGRSSPERRYHAVRGNRGNDVPLVVLINSVSASASEIVAGAIQDHDRGLIVGETSFGKGLVQNVFSLSENTGLAMTTAKWYTPSGRLIQRDYKSVSLYDYHYSRRNNNNGDADVRLTDSGRQVFGGGGIAPDVVVETPKFTPFQELLLRRSVLFPFEIGVGDFTRYFLGKKPTVSRNFEVDDAVMAEFRSFLDRQNIPYTEVAMAENREWIARKIKREVFLSVFGMNEAFRVELEADIQLQKAIEMLPEARALYERARKVMAQRQGAPGQPARP